MKDSLSKKLGALGLVSSVLAGSAMAENTGSAAIITEIGGFTTIATACVTAAVAVVVIPWGAKMAIKAFKAIVG